MDIFNWQDPAPFTLIDAKGIKHSFPRRDTVTFAHLSCPILFYTCSTGRYISVAYNDDAAPTCMECISRVHYK